MKTFLVEELNKARKLVDELRPDDCCKKAIMHESNGNKTPMCIDSCKWSKLELSIATALVDAGILEKK